MNGYSWLVALSPLVVMACGGNSSGNSNSGQTSMPSEVKSSLAYNSNPTVTTDTQQAVINDLNNFGSAVFQGLAPSDQNFAVSPVSGFIALTMTADGAQGTTADEMKTVLYPDVAITDIQAATNQLEQRVRGYARPSAQTSDGSKQVELNLANDVFVQKDLAIQQAFLDNLAVNYDSGVELVDYRTNPDAACKQINNWVASETNNQISNLIPSGSLDDLTRLVLVDALYLNATWQTAFDANSTDTQTFHGINGDSSTDFMSMGSDPWPSFNYASGSGWVGVDIPYYGGSLVLTAILPDSGQFDSVKAGLNAAWFSSFDASVQQQSMSLNLPKFSITGNTVSWAPTLESLGMITLFDRDTCNLNGIAQDWLYVKDVLQQVYIKVAEKGTEAAAATAVVVNTTLSAPLPPPVVLVFDRPFLFFVREHGGPILFAGQVVSLP